MRGNRLSLTARVILAAAILLAACGGKPKVGPYPWRWVFVHDRALDNPMELDTIRVIAQTAAIHGFNGMVISAHLDRLDIESPQWIEGVKELRKIGEESGLKIIPLGFSAGYGYSVMAHDKNLSEGLPVEAALLVVRKGQARLVPDPEPGLPNGSFEAAEGDSPSGWQARLQPGARLSLDRETFHDGRAALCFDSLSGGEESQNVVTCHVVLKKHRAYRLSGWLKSDSLRPSRAFRFEIVGGDRSLYFYDPGLAPTNDWLPLVMGFNTLGYDTVEVRVGAVGASQGRLWVDGLTLEEVGPVNILRRSGCPLTVRGEKNGTVYEEGKDFAPLADPELNFRYDHDSQPLRVLPGGRIKEGERLRVSWYQGLMSVQRKDQITVCMSAPELYELWGRQISLINEYLAPDFYFLDMDEIRAGGTDKACTDRNLTMGEILGDCITRLESMIHAANPNATVVSWSDMFEPDHNASDRWGKYYFLVNGLFTGSWEHVPKDLVMVSWWGDVRKESLAFLSSQNFRIMGSIYTGGNSQEMFDWQADLAATPGVQGVMYTTWERDYRNLADFGDLFSKPYSPR